MSEEIKEEAPKKKVSKKVAKKVEKSDEPKKVKILSRNQGTVYTKSGVLKFDELLEVEENELALLDKIGVKYKKF